MEDKKQTSFSHRSKMPELYIKEKIPLFSENILKQIRSKKYRILLDSQIDQKKLIIHDLFLKKFGPNFFKKDNIVDEFKIMFGKYILNLNEKSLNKNKSEDINKKKKKKSTQKELNTKINMGNMTYLNLKEKVVSNNSSMNDKLFFLSKNLSISNKEKNVITNIAPRKKKSSISNNKIINSKNEKINNKDINKKNNKNIDIEKKNFSKNINIIKNKEKEKGKENLKTFGNSLSQKNIIIPYNNFNSKKYLISNKTREEINLETLSSYNQQHYETEKMNKNFLSTNNLKLNRYETKKDNNSNSLMSNSQTAFYSPQISNFILPKYNNTLPYTDRKKLKSLYLMKNMNNSEINNNLIYNQCKSSSANVTNKENKNIKHDIKRYNSIINLSSIKNLKKIKNNINNETNLLKNFIRKSNKRLVKLIDCNFHKNIKKAPLEEMQRRDNFYLVTTLIDKKISNKLLKKLYKQETKIKPILKMSQSDENELTHNKKFEKEYFLKHYKNMEDNIALYFVGDLFNTKNIKFQLNEFKEQRKEIKEKKEKENIIKIKRKLSSNSFQIKKIKFNLMNANIKLKNK